MPDANAKQPVSCPECGKRLSAPASYAGRTLKCPQCETTFPCVFDAGASNGAGSGIASIMPPAGGFRMIDVPDQNPKRSAVVELARLGLGSVGALIGAIIGILIWGVTGALTGAVIGVIGIVIVGGLTGLGMRLGYGRFGDIAAGVIAGTIALIAFFVGTAILSEHAAITRGFAATMGLTAAAAFCVAFGFGFDGNDID